MGDLLMIVSASAPRKVTIARCHGIGSDSPRIDILYDSFSNNGPMPQDETPLGTIGLLEVDRARNILLHESGALGAPGGERSRVVQLSTTGEGIRLAVMSQ